MLDECDSYFQQRTQFRFHSFNEIKKITISTFDLQTTV